MMESLLTPGSVAVIGASRTPGKVGHELVANLKAGGFEGLIVPINPSADDVLGLTCYPDLAAAGGSIDLAVVAVPAAAVLSAVEQSIAAGAGAIVVITAGFKEVGAEGLALEQRVAKLCTARGMRLPTLAEWSRAARGDSSQPYPWGSAFSFDGSRGNFGEAPGNGRVEAGCNREGVDFRGDGFPGLAPPCSFPAGNSRYGACDMAGNLAEWVLATAPDGKPDGALAGGNWFDCVPEAWRVDRPVWFPARMTFDGVGFRCVAGGR